MANTCCCGYHTDGRDFTRAELDAHRNVCPWLKNLRDLAAQVVKNERDHGAEVH